MKAPPRASRIFLAEQTPVAGSLELPQIGVEGFPKSMLFWMPKKTKNTVHSLCWLGENIKYIQSQLGHASPIVTLSVYAHLMKSVNQEAACRLENTIFKTNGSKMVAETEKRVMS